MKDLEDDPYVDYLFESLGEHAHIIRGYEGDIRVNKFSADIIDGTDYERVKKEFSDDFRLSLSMKKMLLNLYLEERQRQPA